MSTLFLMRQICTVKRGIHFDSLVFKWTFCPLESLRYCCPVTYDLGKNNVDCLSTLFCVFGGGQFVHHHFSRVKGSSKMESRQTVLFPPDQKRNVHAEHFVLQFLVLCIWQRATMSLCHQSHVSRDDNDDNDDVFFTEIFRHYRHLRHLRHRKPDRSVCSAQCGERGSGCLAAPGTHNKIG